MLSLAKNKLGLTRWYLIYLKISIIQLNEVLFSYMFDFDYQV